MGWGGAIKGQWPRGGAIGGCPAGPAPDRVGSEWVWIWLRGRATVSRPSSPVSVWGSGGPSGVGPAEGEDHRRLACWPHPMTKGSLAAVGAS